MKKIDEIEIKKNKKESFVKKILLKYIPVSISILLMITYVFTNNSVFLWILSGTVFISLFGIEFSHNSCPNCGKWNSVNWEKSEWFEDKEKIVQETAFGKQKYKMKKIRIYKRDGKCQNCAEKVHKESKFKM